MGTTDVPQYLQMESTQQFSHLKGTIEGGIVKACSISSEPGASVAEQLSTSKQYLPPSVAAIPEQSYSSGKLIDTFCLFDIVCISLGL